LVRPFKLQGEGGEKDCSDSYEKQGGRSRGYETEHEGSVWGGARRGYVISIDIDATKSYLPCAIGGESGREGGEISPHALGKRAETVSHPST